MSVKPGLRAPLIVAALILAAPSALAEDGGAPTTADEVRAEISEAMEAVAAYSAQERDQALSEARAALTRLDAEIERREQALRENWAGMSDAAREAARSRLRELREARDELGERYGALQAGAGAAWEELSNGFADAWEALAKAWSAADDDAAAN